MVLKQREAELRGASRVQVQGVCGVHGAVIPARASLAAGAATRASTAHFAVTSSTAGCVQLRYRE